jgi:Nif-specific regulatory protein
MAFSLRATAGPLEGSVFPLAAGGEVTIGRDPGNSLPVLSPSVSRFHCRVEPSGTSWRIVDLQARNRTRVNGEPVESHVLAPGDRIGIGTSVFVFSASTDSSASGDETVLERGASGYFDLALAGRLPADERTLACLNALLRVSHAIHGARGFDALENQVLETLLEITPADHVAILIGGNGLDGLGPARGLARGEEGLRAFTPSRTIVERVLRDGVAIASNNVLDEDQLSASQSLIASGVRSVVAAPLGIRGETIGMLYLDALRPKAPFDEPMLQLISAVANIVALAADHARYQQWLEEENGRLRGEIEVAHNLVGESPRLQEVSNAIARVAPSDTTVLIQGESGTGKELVARAIHRASPRAQKLFCAINCAALTETLLESELFGHEKGAFTGATAQKKGKLEVAEGGTVFLDEIGEMSPVLQAKLLRVLQERECERVGGTRPIKLDIRLIAATNRDLKEMAKSGAFRADLYYRINVIAIRTPPLRERKPDIPLLAEHFTRRYAARVKRNILGISPQARQRLMQYDWPGNVRELENAIERAAVLGASEWIQPDDLPESVLEGTSPETGASVTLYDRLRDAKRDIVIDALKQTGGNFTHAGELLGVHANHLHRLVRTLGIDTRKL